MAGMDTSILALQDQSATVAVIGLGYVGLPLAIEFGKIITTIGYDISTNKVKSYLNGIDPSAEESRERFHEASKLTFTSNAEDIAPADFFLIAVPTPVDDNSLPDFTPLISATKTVGGKMKPGSIVVYESTVYRGATEEICIPVLEKYSNLVWVNHPSQYQSY